MKPSLEQKPVVFCNNTIMTLESTRENILQPILITSQINTVSPLSIILSIVFLDSIV